MDTWRLLFRTTLDRPSEQRIFDVGRYKAQWFAGHSVLALEGHPSCDGLAQPWGLESAYQEALEDLREWGHVPTAFAGLARLDSTVTREWIGARVRLFLPVLRLSTFLLAIRSFVASRLTRSRSCM